MMIYGWISGKTNLSGSIAGGIIAFTIYIEVGLPVLVYFLAFFLVGSLASKWQYQKKLSLDLAQENKGRRTAVHAFCNAGAALLFAQLTLLGYSNSIVHFSIACVFAAATSDTLSSELGNVLGSRHINILTLKPYQRGSDGAISMEGTLAGLAGSLLIALLYFLFTGGWFQGLLVLLIGLMANFFDSVLGVSLQRKGKINNNMVNLLATLFAGLLGYFFGILFT